MRRLIQLKKNYSHSNGFSLVEMAVVLVILGFVISALLLPLQAQRDQNFRIQTENALVIAQKALLGYAQTKGRLPCPSIANGFEQAGGPTGCIQQAGFLPATTLGLETTNVNGLLMDGWNNPIRYAVTITSVGGAATADFTTGNDLNTLGISILNPNLMVCSSASTCSAANYLTNNAVAVIFSTGKNYLQSAGIDEASNLTATTTFYSRAPTASGSAEGEFDDMLVWISPFVLYNSMIQAGQLH